MDRAALQSTAATYPYLQGLWAIPLGIMIALAGVSNLDHGPGTPVLLGLLGGALLVCWAGCRWIAAYYREHYGAVTPSGTTQRRHVLALVSWMAVLFVGANKHLFWSPDSSFCVYTSAFALATLVYYAMLVGLRRHHLVLWGTLFAVGLIPIWGGLGQDRDPVAMMIDGAALIASGLLDQRLLARALGSTAAGSGQAGLRGGW